MNHQIVEHPAFTIVGKALRVSMENGENFKRIPEFWETCNKDGTSETVSKRSAGGKVLPNVIVGMCSDFTADMSEFTYTIGAESGDGTVPDGMVATTIPALTWAKFEAIGPPPEVIQSVMHHIWNEFFAAGAYSPCPAPSLEVYPHGDPMKPDYRFEIWTAVTKN